MSAIPRDRSPSAVARATRAIARATAPLTRPLAGRRFLPLWAVVHHRGRRSGRPYAVPVAIRVSDDAFIIPLPWGAETEWLRNVLAADGSRIRWRGADHRGTAPRIVDLAGVADAFHPLQLAVMRAGGVRSALRLRREISSG